MARKRKYSLTSLCCNSKHLVGVGVGLVLLLMGLDHLMKLSKFVPMMTGSIGVSWLPTGLLELYFYVLPFVMVASGIGLITGYYKEKAALLGMLVWLTFIFGNVLMALNMETAEKLVVLQRTVPAFIIFLLGISYSMD